MEQRAARTGAPRIAFRRRAHPTHCRQPFEIQTPEGRVVWVQNGETYNHDDIREKELKGQALSSSSDCAVTGPLFVHNNRDFG